MNQYKKSDSSLSFSRRGRRVCRLALMGALLALLILMLPGDTQAETYSVANGVLTISGTGAMTDYRLASSSSDDMTTSPYENMDDVTSIVIEEGITTIGHLAFTYMNNVREVTLPSTLSSLDSTSMQFGSHPTRVNWMGTVDQLIGAVYGKTTGTRMFGGAALCLSDGQPLTELHLTASSPSVKAYAFKGCSTLTSVTVDADYTGSIGCEAFDGSGLTDITFLGEPPHIDPDAFYGVTAAISYTRSMAWDDLMSRLRGNLTWNSTVDTLSGAVGSQITWTLYADGTLAIRGTGPMEDYNLSVDQPWSYGNTNVTINRIVVYPGITHIGDAAFSMLRVKTVSLPDTVTTIGKWAFQEDLYITSINMPAQLVSIGRAALSGLKALTTLTFKCPLSAWTSRLERPHRYVCAHSQLREDDQLDALLSRSEQRLRFG